MEIKEEEDYKELKGFLNEATERDQIVFECINFKLESHDFQYAQFFNGNSRYQRYPRNMQVNNYTQLFNEIFPKLEENDKWKEAIPLKVEYNKVEQLSCNSFHTIIIHIQNHEDMSASLDFINKRMATKSMKDKIEFKNVEVLITKEILKQACQDLAELINLIPE